MRLSFGSFLLSLIIVSCNQDEFPGYSGSAVNFEVSGWVMKGEDVSCLDFDPDGNAWIGSGSSLVFYDGNKFKAYDAGSEILDISASTDGSIWLGTHDKGLARFDDQKFTYYTVANSGLPRDLVLEVEVASDQTVWFSSSAHMLGGLMHFDGKKFELFTPENSPLNQNLILSLKADGNGNIFFTSEGTVTQTKVFRIDKRGKWGILGGDSGFYWIASVDVNSKSEPVVTTDHSLSSCMGCYSNDVLIFRDGKWEKLNAGFELSFFSRVVVDKRDFIWVQGSLNGSYSGFLVFDGKDWQASKEGQIPDVFIHSVKVDKDNNIWFCSNNGIFILKQS